MKTTTNSCFLSVSLAALAFASVSAADSFAQSVDNEEEIVVTGTRLRGVAPVGSPIQSITSQDLEDVTETSTARVIQQIPQIFDLGVSEGSRAQNGGSGNVVYSTGINLRGLGPFATLVLVDGHRAVSNQRALDPSVMPGLGLQRIEVLSDGASAIYGSDAVAGVVNLVPVRFRDEVQVMGRYGVGDRYFEYEAGFAWGEVWEDGQVHVAYERSRRSNVAGRDRDFFRQNLTDAGGLDYRVAQCDPGNIVVAGTSYAIPAGGVTPANATALVAGTENRCEGSLNQDLLPEQEYETVAFTLNHQLTPVFELIADGFYSQRDFYRQVVDTTGNLNVPNTNAFFVAPPGLTPASETVRYSFRDDLPSDDQTGKSRNWEITAGFAATLPRDWRFEALTTYGESHDWSETRNGINNGALAAALASSNPETALDPYGLHRTNQAVLDGLADQVFLTPLNNFFRGYELRLGGPLFSLPGGEVQLATGIERQDLEYSPGGGRGGPTYIPTFRYFQRSVQAYYVEVLVPLVGPENAMPGIQRLELNIAGRHDDYSDIGGTSNPKLGLNWTPFDGMNVRASYGTSLRAPSFAELYGNSSALYPQNYTDPTLPGVRQGVALSGGNLDLQPEEATTWTVGFDYTPEGIPGLRLSGTYFDIEYEGQVAAQLGNLNVLALESEFEGTGVITRGAEAEARVAQLLSQGLVFVGAPPARPVNLFIDGRTLNLGRTLMSGVDLEGAYSWDAGDVGEFTASLYAAFILENDISITPTGTLVDRLDTIFYSNDFKMRGSLAWDRGALRAVTMLNYQSGYTNNILATAQEVDAYMTVDANVSYDLGETGVTLGLDARNLLDEEPPFVNIAPGVNGSGGYDATASNPTGRVIGVSLRKRF